MYQTVNLNTFTDTFQRMERHDSWGYEGLKTLFELLTLLEEDGGKEMELDVIALDSQFTYYKDFDELYETYSHHFENAEQFREIGVAKWLCEHTVYRFAGDDEEDF